MDGGRATLLVSLDSELTNGFSEGKRCVSMGTKASRQSPTANDPNHCVYATRKRQTELSVIDDLPRLTNQPLSNLAQQPPLSVSSQEKVQRRVESPRRSLELRKDRSTDHSAHSNTINTGEPSIEEEAKRSQPYRSPSSSSTSVNPITTKNRPKHRQSILINPKQLTVGHRSSSFTNK